MPGGRFKGARRGMIWGCWRIVAAGDEFIAGAVKTEEGTEGAVATGEVLGVVSGGVNVPRSNFTAPCPRSSASFIALAMPDGKPDARCAGSFGIKLGGAVAGGADGAAVGETFVGDCPEAEPEGRLRELPLLETILREGILELLGLGIVERGLLREGMLPLFWGLVPEVFR
jgi:hypothetical protein